MAGSSPILDVRGLSAGYGRTPVVRDVCLTVADGEVVTILGGNGAGKTTTLKAVLGLLAPAAGDVYFDGKPWDGRSPHRAARTGMAYIPSEQFVFPGLSVVENLALGERNNRSRPREAVRERSFTLFPRLRERATQLAGTMSGGEQRMLSVAVALSSDPKLLLLDEPSLGLAPVAAQDLLRTIVGLVRERSLSVLMVEQNVGLALEIADRAYVLRSGEVIAHESADDLKRRNDWWSLY